MSSCVVLVYYFVLRWLLLLLLFVCSPPPAVLSLCSFMGMQMRFCHVTNRDQAQLGMWFKEQAALGDRGVSIW